LGARRSLRVEHNRRRLDTRRRSRAASFRRQRAPRGAGDNTVGIQVPGELGYGEFPGRGRRSRTRMPPCERFRDGGSTQGRRTSADTGRAEWGTTLVATLDRPGLKAEMGLRDGRRRSTGRSTRSVSRAGMPRTCLRTRGVDEEAPGRRLRQGTCSRRPVTIPVVVDGARSDGTRGRGTCLGLALGLRVGGAGTKIVDDVDACARRGAPDCPRTAFPR
jgi:hypothetical protein